MAAARLSETMTLAQFERLFPTEEACKSYLAAHRWPDGPVCVRCGNARVYPFTNRPFHWQCTRCAAAGGYRFSLLVGTIFENTNIALRTWFKVIHLMLTSEAGISALEIQRMFGFGSYRTSHFMWHRIRAGLGDPEFRRLMGIGAAEGRPSAGKDGKQRPPAGSVRKTFGSAADPNGTRARARQNARTRALK
ncbi:MAG: transposase [Methylobacteriaceae bacterium]|nr:transposase [Methylobacteriaceae bacterium]MBV9633921.1 transposase [Methylobacteriaceae bacterium]